MTSQIRSLVEYLISTDNILLLLSFTLKLILKCSLIELVFNTIRW